MRHHRLDHADFSAHFPWLDENTLKGGFTYGDAQTDDARLVLELVAGAIAHGAVCVNHANSSSGTRTAAGMRRDRARCRRRRGAAGARAAIASRLPGSGCPRARPAGVVPADQGVHLVLPALPGSAAILLTAKSDGRVFFVIPCTGARCSARPTPTTAATWIMCVSKS